MIKKLLLILFFCLSFSAFSQEKDVENLNAIPNPFSNNTTITFESKSSNEAVFTVYNVLGKAIYREKLSAKKGTNSFVFSKNNLANGVYVYSIQVKENIVTKRFVIQ